MFRVLCVIITLLAGVHCQQPYLRIDNIFYTSATCTGSYSRNFYQNGTCVQTGPGTSHMVCVSLLPSAYLNQYLLMGWLSLFRQLFETAPTRLLSIVTFKTEHVTYRLHYHAAFRNVYVSPFKLRHTCPNSYFVVWCAMSGYVCQRRSPIGFVGCWTIRSGENLTFFNLHIAKRIFFLFCFAVFLLLGRKSRYVSNRGHERLQLPGQRGMCVNGWIYGNCMFSLHHSCSYSNAIFFLLWMFVSSSRFQDQL